MNARGPTIYAAVAENRLIDARQPINDLVNNVIASALQGDARRELYEIVRQAYTRGVVDGFAQGASAPVSPAATEDNK